ncbi:alanine--tRNA ligase [Stenotrophomonas maltophilia]|uniref:alanine--tRNA ligase n=1 Tax=Stenotrophomonas TaxID=40323 RepID=UPI00113D8B29|nr:MULTISPECIES: alanine--tRNA ligase [Stenotrophomonas]MBN5151622.1 alanine--tRNA ligase [Stenotrophomonas maltophilia]TGR51843.1 alanine--tRNA ligase [bacterium M00.F.Ca.ET.199.01.1.1]TGT05443.1 alanine--tRNA ligase [bacterium M00.F.Ca.ET.177.01.1.1]TGT62518.1 alanine--tRNA ligase [Mesorhizobium sp. M00.F.Ca.ET.170.01.1.1]TGU14376.1 alanine--tRNA ligase [bacterium M00.F.Ca.ET.163.01.1.1]TGU96280.1 alanine--tRNA ligase [Mesorhizobium sp. M00.F.Ca.ET.151.01.1.1]TGV58550.1 alanine--tRNA ligas
MNASAKFTTSQIRSDFLEFFKGKGHTIVPSAPLVPGNDPTLLFTNSGMVQFKDVFLGAEKRSYVRAADVQRCLRAGGKHNDLDQVGYTARHHTFFEMLGNWSFGDYFKKDAIAWAWELLTQVWKLPAERLLVTVYQTDDEAYALWRDMVGVPEERIVRIGDNKGAPFASDNFWQMADTGPCGPCTEIFYDHGDHIAGGPPGSPDEDGDRFIEIWNLVFMQFDRQPDGSLVPLPAPCVDTGMGLERLAAILQHVHTNYEIDLFQALIRKAAELTGTADLENKSLRVIADHIRACSFLIVDGVLPSNEGRGYVLRRIIRRALRHGWMLGVRQPFFSKLVPTLVEQMGEAYPELPAAVDTVTRALQAEEERFAETLDAGMKIFEDVAGKASNGVIPGVDAFRLYDTYGFPLDLTQDIARERDLTVDIAGFDAAMEQQRETARAAGKFGGGVSLPAELVATLSPTRFLGYDRLQADGLTVLALLKDGRPVQSAAAGDAVIVITDQTPFYAESGGQVGDTGVLAGNGVRLAVEDTQKFAGQFHGHVGTLSEGGLKVGDVLAGQVDGERRGATILNHSATHLLHAALREVLGTHVQQKGSLVAPDRLRFDFSHFQPISAEELALIERKVNQQVRANNAAEVHTMGMQEALDFGAMALFGEKYGEHVRVLKMGDYSTELCGGTHVNRTGDIGLFKITSEGGVSAGVRRIEAVTGQGALDYVDAEEARLAEAAELLGGSAADVVEKIRALGQRQKQLERELEAVKAKVAAGATADLSGQAVEVAGVKVLAARLEGFDAKALRDAMDRLKQQLGDAVIVLAGAQDGKAALVAGVNGSAMGKVKAGELLSHIASQIGGKGGGRPDLAQGGGEDGPALATALAAVVEWVSPRL